MVTGVRCRGRAARRRGPSEGSRRGRYCVTGFWEGMGRRHKSTGAALASLLVLASMLGPAFGLGGCAGVPTDPDARAAYDAANDPIEPLNRATFEVNMVVDRFLWEPLAIGYQEAVPELIQ